MFISLSGAVGIWPVSIVMGPQSWLEAGRQTYNQGLEGKQGQAGPEKGASQLAGSGVWEGFLEWWHFCGR